MGKTYRSDALGAIHETASDLHEAGLMDKQTLRKFDALCLPSYNIAVLKCQIGLRYSSSDSILNPFPEAETDETMLEQQ